MLAKIHVAPAYLQMDEGVHAIYLAGAIDMGAAVDWQRYVIDKLSGEHCVIMNPRRETPFTPDMLDGQIEWELYAMDIANTILMWFPQDSKAPVAMFEAGIYWNDSKLVVGAEAGFYRRRNLELTADFYQRTLYPNLDDLITIARARMDKTSAPF